MGRRDWRTGLTLAGLAVLVLIVAWPLRDLATDDPYITYRYARNLALGRGFVYNVGERTLSTTAPFYAVLLAVGASLGADIPTLSNVLGALGFWAAASSLFLLGRRNERPWAGLIAALLCATSPLLWLALGFEVGFYIALVCWAFWACDARRWTVSALVLALATIIRNDAVVAVGVVGLTWLIERRPRKVPWRPLCLYIAIVCAFALWLTVQFGSPIPVTLKAKIIQADFGLTGFYLDTTFLQGAAILWRAWSQQTHAYWLALPLVLLGLAVLRRERWAWGLIAWGGLVTLAYAVLQVAPYPWYYAPLAPLLALLVGLGIESVGRGTARRVKGTGALVVAALVLPLMLLALLVGAHVVSLNRAARAQWGEVPPPEQVAAKVLPEVKTDVYRRAGEWLAANTPPEATVGVLEVGVMGYYADRRMVDFLGLLQPPVAQAMARGDIFWAVPAYAPDYMALTAVNPLYTYPILKNEWFQRAYRPVAVLSDARFWGSPLTIYRRVGASLPLKQRVAERPVVDGVALIAWAADDGPLAPEMPLRVRLTWRALTPAALDGAQVSVYLVDAAWNEVGKRVLRYDTSAWPAGEDVEVYHPLVVAGEVPAGRYGLRVRVEDVGGVERFEGEVGWLKRPPAGAIPPEAVLLDVQAGFARLAGYTLASEEIHAGQPLTLTLYWTAESAGNRDWTVFVHLLDGAGQRMAQADGPPMGGRYPTTAWAAGEIVADAHTLSLPDVLPGGPYQLLVGLYDLTSGERLPLFDARGEPLPEQAVSLEVP
jgi:hypothetical protein